MLENFFRKALETQEVGRPHVLAVVIAVRGSSSAKTGARALISQDGRNLWGWVGGGCAESFIIKQSLEALEEHRPRIITVDLDDELLGVGMPCGGYMDVYLEPVYPPARLWLPAADAITTALTRWAPEAGFAVTVQSPGVNRQKFPMASETIDAPFAESQPASNDFMICIGEECPQSPARIIKESGSPPDDALIGFSVNSSLMGRTLGLLGRLRASYQGASGTSLSMIENHFEPLLQPELYIVGRGRISEELARMGLLLGWPVTVNDPALNADDYGARAKLITDDLDLDLSGIGPASHVILAGQHKGDHKAALTALRHGAPYIGLIASRKRSGLVLDFLRERACDPEGVARIHAPAGLDIGAITPFDIALSIVLQIGSGGK